MIVDMKVAPFCNHIEVGTLIYSSIRRVGKTSIDTAYFYSCEECANRELTPEEQKEILNPK